MKITKSVIIAGLNPIGEKVKQVLEEEGCGLLEEDQNYKIPPSLQIFKLHLTRNKT